MPFHFAARKILSSTGATITYDTGVNPNRLIALNYSGTIHEALNRLSAKSGYHYSIHNNNLTWTSFITRTFDVSFMPGSSSYMVGKDQNQAATTNTSSIDQSQSVGSSLDTEYSNLAGNVSVWHDLDNTLQKLKSARGIVEISQATTTVTVRDDQAHVNAIDHYIKQLNGTLSREVLIRVQVLEVQLNDQFNYGIDWNIVSGKLQLSGSNFVKPVAPTEPSTFIVKWAGSSALIQALMQQGRVSRQTYPSVVTLNNQVAQIGINTQTAYLKQTSTTINNLTTTTSATPGVINEGFTLYVLPKIQGNNVYLQISSTLAKLLNIQNASFKDAAGNINYSIQLPQVAYKRFNVRSAVPNQYTLILAGFKQLESETHKAALLGSWDLGGKTANKSNTETIVLITPTIIRKLH